MVMAFVRRTFDRLRRWLSRNELVVRWLGLSRYPVRPDEPGLILIQIDGLSRTQLERALRRRRMPFLRKLLRKRGYRLETMYSGIPSSTPAVQGELFFGVRCAVPAFSFRDPELGQIVRMFDRAAAAQVEQRLAAQGAGLLEQGSAYCDIYSGGAAETHFCASRLGVGYILRHVRPWIWVSILVWHSWSMARIFALMGLEFIIALGDFVRGQMDGRDLGKELKMVPTRVAVSVGLRELMAIGAAMDATRGLPIIQLNFLGYDEQSHRRGPQSAFAHWSLQGIDDAIKRIYQAARRSSRRAYRVWIYSDHGQERTQPYARKFGRSVQEAVAEIFGAPLVAPLPKTADQIRAGGEWIATRAAHQLESAKASRTPSAAAVASADRDSSAELTGDAQRVEVVSMGPLGHIYPATELSPAQLEHVAEQLVRKAGVPMVLAPAEADRARAWTKRGCFELPAQAAEVLGADHPFLETAANDLVCLCHHPHAGAILIVGWAVGETPITFAIENGAHAGPGSEETRAFVMLPPDAPVLGRTRGVVRPLDLRHAVQTFLRRDPDDVQKPSPREEHEPVLEGDSAAITKAVARSAAVPDRRSVAPELPVSALDGHWPGSAEASTQRAP